MTTYLRTYPVPWPIFSTKNYSKDEEGWWNPKKKFRRNKKKTFYGELKGVESTTQEQN